MGNARAHKDGIIHHLSRMKNILRVILGVIELGAGALFLASSASDIQLGFGLVFVFLGASAIVSVLK